MLGGKPRQQAIGHVLGIIAGAVICVPVFYIAFLRNNPGGLISKDYPMPGATIWKAVAEILTRGISELPVSAVYAALIGGMLGLILEAIKTNSKGRFPISAVGLGLAFVIPFSTCLAMFLGSFLFWLAAKLSKNEASLTNRIFVQNLEPVAAGVIAGGALMGILIAVLSTLI